MLQLQRGVMTTCADGKSRVLKAFVALFTGDMPTVSKCLRRTGRNARKPCRFCHFAATSNPSRKSIHCIPSDDEKELRSSEEMMEVWDILEAARVNGTQAQHLRLAKRWGVKRKPVLPSLMMDFTNGVPHDPMRLPLLG